MAIDVLSQSGTAPIIVGDAADMADLQEINSDSEGRYFLRMAGHDVGLTPPACENFATAKHLLLVDVTGIEVSRARRVRIESLDDSQELNEEQCRALTEALARDDNGDFRDAKLAEFRRTHPDLAAA